MTDQTRIADFLSDDLAKALQHLRMALACLDAAEEMQAPPYVQMAIDALLGSDEDDANVSHNA